MQGLKIVPAILILIFFSVLLADDGDSEAENFEFGGYVSAGGGYDSYIPSLGKDPSERLGSAEILLDTGINLDFYDFFTSLSFLTDAYNAESWSHSLFTTALSAGWGKTYGDFDLSLALNGGFTAYDFQDFRAYYGEAGGEFELFFNHSENMGWYFDLSAAYTHGVDSMLEYLRGTSAGFGTGEYFYFGEFDSYVRISGKVSFFFYDDISEKNYSYLGSKGISALSGKNRGAESSAGIMTKLNREKIYLAASANYSNVTMFDKDSWEYTDRIVKKRSSDHIISFELEPGWTPIEELTISLDYTFEKDFSTFGKDDYADNNYFRHVIKLLVTYDF